jgi:hypothetical protein
METLQDEYPSKCFMNAVVLYYSSGDVVIRTSNTVLTIANLYDVSGMLIILQNDLLHKIKSTEFHDLNDIIALKIGSILQPSLRSELSKIYDIVSHLTPHPHCKFITIKSAAHYPKAICVYEANVDWNVLVRHMKQTLRVNYFENVPVFDWEMKLPQLTHSFQHSVMQYSLWVSNLLVSRGMYVSDVQDPVLLPLEGNDLYLQWIPKDSRCLHLHQNRRFMDVEKFISLATNNSSFHYSFSNTVDKAWKSYIHKAHLHQCSKFRIKDKEFLESFAKMEIIIKSYKDLK